METQSDAAGSSGGEERREVGRLSSQRVDQLSRFLRHQQEVVYKQENISKYFSPAIQKGATKCWEQIHPNITTAIEGKYSRVLEEWNVNEKLAELDKRQLEHPKAMHAWRPTGIPEVDSQTAESAESGQVVPQFKMKLATAQSLSCDLEQQLREREAELAQLDYEIDTLLSTLTQSSSSLTPNQ